MDPNHTERSLRGRAAWVTGGGSGIGLAIALRLARAGADVALVSLTHERVSLQPNELKYFPSGSTLAEASQAVERHGVRCLAFDADVSAEAEVQQAMEQTVEAFGHLDILVNCAATSCVHPVLDHSPATWRRVIEVNLIGAFLCARAALPHLLSRGWGRIINIGSTAATHGYVEYSAYCAAKHGLLGFTRSLAAELTHTAITANMVSPATVETPSSPIFVEHFARKEGKAYADKWNEMVNAYPQHRLITAEEVAELVCYLTRDEARAITGEDLRITMGSHW